MDTNELIKEAKEAYEAGFLEKARTAALIASAQESQRANDLAESRYDHDMHQIYGPSHFEDWRT